jgi:hypothetical protein
MGAKARRELVWDTLQYFWPEKKVMEWHESIFQVRKNLRGEDTIDITLPGDDNNPANLITLSRDAHAFWNDGKFALKPLELLEDQKTRRPCVFSSSGKNDRKAAGNQE